MSFSSLLNKTCTIQAPTEAFSASSTVTITYTNRTTTAKCAIQPKTGSLSTEEQEQDINFSHIGYFEIGETILNDDKVIESGVEYKVVFVKNAAGRGHHKEVLLEQLPS